MATNHSIRPVVANLVPNLWKAPMRFNRPFDDLWLAYKYNVLIIRFYIQREGHCTLVLVHHTLHRSPGIAKRPRVGDECSLPSVAAAPDESVQNLRSTTNAWISAQSVASAVTAALADTRFIQLLL